MGPPPAPSATLAAQRRSPTAAKLSTPPRARQRTAPAASAGSSRTPAGQTRAAVLAALSTERPLTAGEVATATGLARQTVSTTLSRLAQSGEVAKADRGYRLP